MTFRLSMDHLRYQYREVGFAEAILSFARKVRLSVTSGPCGDFTANPVLHAVHVYYAGKLELPGDGRKSFCGQVSGETQYDATRSQMMRVRAAHRNSVCIVRLRKTR